jgi:hypothetical protein
LAYTLTVQFSNGKLQNPGDMRFTLYNSTDLVNPRQRSHRIVVSACWYRWSGLCRPQKVLGVGRHGRPGLGGRKGGVANETLAPLRSKILGFSLIWALSFQTGFLPVALAILEITI